MTGAAPKIPLASRRAPCMIASNMRFVSLGETPMSRAKATSLALLVTLAGCAAAPSGYDYGAVQTSTWTPASYQLSQPPAAPGPNPTNFGTPYYVSAPPRGACTSFHIAAPC